MSAFHRNRRDSQAGFTLVELLVVAAIIGTTAGFLLLNFATSRVNLTAASDQLIAELRDVQSRSVEATHSDGTLRCGFGVKPDPGNANAYLVYQGPDASTVDCSTLDRNYSSGEDSIYERYTLSDPNLEFKGSSGSQFPDVFFEPPDPRTYIDDSATLDTLPARLLFGVKDVTCTGTDECRAVCIYPSGRIQRAPGLVCP